MNYQEALQHKKESLKNADENVLENFHLIISPADTEESTRYIEDFLKNPDNFNDESCKKYCSNDEFQVVSFKKENK
ncbi:hypothetical protein [Chryseobacterium sp. MMS23-Vi53]|uniref:hypothetical protein n=1 Tax=Chryseobacterium sp. MMS23-Vi53 TaxID=3386644 RepID=UPI0039E98EAB